MAGWVEVNVATTLTAAEAVVEALRPLAYAEGVAQEQLGDPDNPDPNALLPEVHVKIYWPAGEDSPARRARVRERIGALDRGTFGPIGPPRFATLADVEWAEAWKAHYRPFRVGRRLWITPTWEAAPIDGARRRDDDIVVSLDPGMAFGTGLHATTRLCLEALEGIVEPGQTVLDVGTGSGILAIAAAHLGAARVLATDSDPLAVAAARANAVINGVEGRVTVIAGTSPPAEGYDLVLVNILAPVIIKLLDQGLARWGDRLILSGIIEAQTAAVEAALGAAGSQIQARWVQGDWVALLATGSQPKAP